MSASNGANGASSLQNAALAAEMKAYNATLTQAGNKLRPGRGLNGRGRGLMLDAGFRIAPGRSTAGANGQRSSNDAAMLSNGPVTSRNSAPVRRGYSRINGRTSHASPHLTYNPWSAATLASNPPSAPTPAFAAVPPHLIKAPASTTLQTAAASPQSAGAIWASSGSSEPQVFDSIGITASAGNATGSVPSVSFAIPAPAFATTTNHPNGLQHAVVSTRQPIVTNWGPDPVGPQIPTHLRQPSAAGAIAEIAEMIGMKYDDLTSDGITIPAPRPRAASQQRLSIQPTVLTEVHNGARVQQNVEPAAWIAAAKPDQPESSSEMDVDMDGDMTMAPAESVRNARNLWDSVWAAPSWDLPVKKPASYERATTTPFSQPSALSVGSANATSINAENVRPMATLKDSKWATPSIGAPSRLVAPTVKPFSFGQPSNPFTSTVANSFSFGQHAEFFGPASTTAFSGNPFSSGTPSNPLTPASNPAPTPMAAVPVAKEEKPVKYLKDSMWAH